MLAITALSLAVMPAEGAVMPKAGSDSLIIISEDALVAQLMRLVQERQETVSSDDASTMELLRLQLMFDLFAPQSTPVAQPIATIPTGQPSPSVHISQGTDTSNADLSARLSRLETMLTMLLARQGDIPSTPTQTPSVVSLAQPYQSQSPQVINPTVTIQQRSIRDSIRPSDARIAELERRLSEALDRLNSKPDSVPVVVPAPEVKTSMPQLVLPLQSEVPIEVITDTIHIEHTTEVVSVADFKRSLYFAVGQYHLDSQARQAVYETIDFLKRFPNAQVKLHGFASPDGNRASNERLARRRMDATAEMLIAEGIAPERILRGDTSIDTSTSAPQLARRVDITLVEP